MPIIIVRSAFVSPDAEAIIFVGISAYQEWNGYFATSARCVDSRHSLCRGGFVYTEKKERDLSTALKGINKSFCFNCMQFIDQMTYSIICTSQMHKYRKFIASFHIMNRVDSEWWLSITQTHTHEFRYLHHCSTLINHLCIQNVRRMEICGKLSVCCFGSSHSYMHTDQRFGWNRRQAYGNSIRSTVNTRAYEASICLILYQFQWLVKCTLKSKHQLSNTQSKLAIRLIAFNIQFR